MRSTFKNSTRFFIILLIVGAALIALPMTARAADVAENDNKTYTSLQAAIEAYDGVGNIKLLQDTTENIKINRTVTIDFNNKVLNGSVTINSGVVQMNNGSIKSSTQPAIQKDSSQNVTIDNFSEISAGDSESDNCIVNNNNSGQMTLEKTTVKGTIQNNGVLVIPNSTVIDGNNAVINDTNGSLEINNSNITATAGSPIVNRGTIRYVDGGTFTAKDNSSPVILNGNNGTIANSGAHDGKDGILSGIFKGGSLFGQDGSGDFCSIIKIRNGDFRGVTKLFADGLRDKVNKNVSEQRNIDATVDRPNNDLIVAGGTFSNTNVQELEDKDLSTGYQKYAAGNQTLIVDNATEAGIQHYDDEVADASASDASRAAALRKKIDELQAEIDDTKAGIPMFRLYNPNSGEHFYTKDVKEAAKNILLGWHDEGVGWVAPKSGVPVYRLYNKYAGEHHYTKDLDEVNHLVKIGWTYEGVGWYSGGKVPVYREYNPYERANNHNYTADKSEHDHLVSIGWRNENIGWYAEAANSAK